MKKKTKKSSAKMYKFRPEDAELFKDVVFLVQCTHHEQFTFWQDYFRKPKYKESAVKSWEQEGSGYLITIGEIDNRPICINVWWEWLEGYRVMFYEATSQVVDYVIVDNWIEHWTLKSMRYDGGYRWAHCDSSNFHHCIHAIQALVKSQGHGPGRPKF